MIQTLHNYFDGQFQKAPLQGRESSHQKHTLLSPADQSVTLWENQICFTHIESILNSAQHGLEKWQKSSYSDRKLLLENYLNLIENKKRELAQTLTLENGQPYTDNLAEIELVLKLSPAILKQFDEQISSKKNCISRPRGPALFIGSFIRPVYYTHSFILANLFSGNSVIIKPSEKVALTTQKLLECLHQANFPTGAINLIHDAKDGEITRRLLKDKRIKIVFFYGTNEVGQPLYDIASTHLERSLSFSLARKNVCILEKGFDKNKALLDLKNSAYSFAGQDCLKTSITFVHTSEKDAFIDLFHEESKKLTINHPEQKPFMGPLINQQALDSYILHIGMAKREGLEEIMRGKHLERSQKGFYVTPSIHYCEKFIEKSHFLQSDLLAPNLTFISYTNLDEAISMANSLEFPSVVSLYSTDISTIAHCQETLETNLILVNRPTNSAINHLNLATQMLERCLRNVDLVKD